MDKVEALNRAWSGLRKGINKVRLAYNGLDDKGKPLEGETEKAADGKMPKQTGRKSMLERAKEEYTKYRGKEKDESGQETSRMPQKGGIGAAVAAAVPIIGRVAAAALGGILKMVSDIGQQYTQAMMSQQGTIGATGKYIGGGGAQFANSEVAAAQIAKARPT
jgi:hypothetical protein